MDEATTGALEATHENQKLLEKQRADAERAR